MNSNNIKDQYRQSRNKAKLGLIIFFILWMPYLINQVLKLTNGGGNFLGINDVIWLGLGLLAIIVVTITTKSSLICPACGGNIGKRTKPQICYTCGLELE